MPASLEHVNADTPMGATLIADGATFRVWAPHARAVHVLGDFNGRQRDDASLLTRDENGHWRGFIPGVRDRDRYMFYVVGDGSEGRNAIPTRASSQTPFPSDCIIRVPDFPWHETGFVTPPFHDFVIYQLHVGAFFTPNLPRKAARFWMWRARFPTWRARRHRDPAAADPGIPDRSSASATTAPTTFRRRWISPSRTPTSPPYVAQVNALLDAKGLRRYELEDLRGEMNQLKALVDLCHLHGLAVILDVVYNHAGGDFGDESLYFFDRQSTAGDAIGTRSTSPTGGMPAGSCSISAKPEVRDFLIQNAKFFLDEYRVDGFRYDQVSVIDHDGAPHGWRFCQDLTSTLRDHRPRRVRQGRVLGCESVHREAAAGGRGGFDTSLTDGLRIAIRDVIGDASAPDERPLDMTGLARSLWPDGFDEHWRFVQGPENHDIVYQVDREHRIARLGDPADPRSWFGRSRARVATGISLTAPGIPMLFMGQEFLEDKQWSDNFEFHPRPAAPLGGPRRRRQADARSPALHA